MKIPNIKERVIATLRDRGVKITPQRRTVIEILTKDGSHPSAGTLLARARESIPTMSASTVYYTLALLKREELIKELEFYDMENRYESDMTDHIDLICTKCGRIDNLNTELPVSPDSIREATGFETERMRFEYYGLCRRCQEEQR